MSVEFENVLSAMRQQHCPQDLNNEIQKVFGQHSEKWAREMVKWLGEGEPKQITDVLLAVYVCNHGLTLLCNETCQEEDAAVHVNNKWQAFDANRVLLAAETTAACGSAVETTDNSECDMKFFEQEIAALSCSDFDFFGAGDD
jgi:hypothetical protein